ncbi:MAG: EscU/YscU/HrcU family type III secretion system export apparatus switch protein [Polyangiaceae bacterium]
MTSKTEEPTPRRLARADREGDSGASTVLAASVTFVVVVAFLEPMATRVVAGLASAFRAAFEEAARAEPRPSLDPATLAGQVLVPLVPALVAGAAAAAFVSVVQTGGTITARPLSPSLGRLDVLAGLRNLVSAPRIASVLRAALGAGVVTFLAYRAFRGHAADVAHVSGRTRAVAPLAWHLVSELLRNAGVTFLALGVLDRMVTVRFRLRRLRMSKDEVRREAREADGNPETKAARERAHHEVLAATVLDAARKATVVVVNPTHLACALRYDAEGGDGAPVVVATGRGDMAARIVAAATEAGVPVVRDVPLARALVLLDIGDAIPEVLYEAVAEILRDASESDDL